MSQPETSYGTGVTPPQTEPGRKVPIYRDWMVVQLVALVFLIDQFTKYLVVQLLPFRTSFPDDGFLRFTHTHNTGSAFGIFPGQNTPLILVSFIGIAILIMIYRSQPRPTNLLRLSLGLQLGGAMGNLIDRMLLGHVTDFIDVGPWPVFNLADASIVTGLVLLTWLFLRPRGSRQQEMAAGIGHNLAPQDARLLGDSWCPICDGDMVKGSAGWHCATCGVRERIEEGYFTTEPDPPTGIPSVASKVTSGDDARYPVPGESLYLTSAGESLDGNDPTGTLGGEADGLIPQLAEETPKDPTPESGQGRFAAPDRPAGGGIPGSDQP